MSLSDNDLRKISICLYLKKPHQKEFMKLEVENFQEFFFLKKLASQTLAIKGTKIAQLSSIEVLQIEYVSYLGRKHDRFLKRFYNLDCIQLLQVEQFRQLFEIRKYDINYPYTVDSL